MGPSLRRGAKAAGNVCFQPFFNTWKADRLGVGQVELRLSRQEVILVLGREAIFLRYLVSFQNNLSEAA